jgi:glycosyltransferase involved in cell wall biosynthesis
MGRHQRAPQFPVAPITVVVASYKYGHLAAHCIETVLGQTRAAEKIILVDDGVGDCTHLPAIYPEVQYVLREENMGTTPNFQDILMNEVKTEWVLLIGADNWLRSDALELLFDTVDDYDVITYDIMITGERAYNQVHATQVDRGDLIWMRRGDHHGSIAYRTKLGQSVGYERYNNTGNNAAEDLFLWNGMKKAKARIKYVAEPLLYYRRHRENYLDC